MAYYSFLIVYLFVTIHLLFCNNVLQGNTDSGPQGGGNELTQAPVTQALGTGITAPLSPIGQRGAWLVAKVGVGGSYAWLNVNLSWTRISLVRT